MDASRLALWTLTIEGRIEAVLLGFVDNGVLHYFQKGFNPAFARDGLGTAMLSLCIRDCFADPAIRVFDFMGGGAQYKDLWARRSRDKVVYEIRRPSFGAAIFRAGLRLKNVAASLYRHVAPKWFRAFRRERLRRHQMKCAAFLCACTLDMDGIAFEMLKAMTSTL